VGWTEDLQDWAKQEVTELRRAKTAAAIVFIIGGGSGWFVASQFYAERFSVMEQRIESLAAGRDVRSSLTTELDQGGIVQEWGAQGARRCTVVVNASNLMQFSKKNAMVLFCGLVRPGKDRVTDTDVSISKPFTIDPAPITIDVLASDVMLRAVDAESMRQQRVDPPPPGSKGIEIVTTVWLEVAVIPTALDISLLHSLADVERFGGQRFPSLGVRVRVPYRRPL
jgi:hypothetical protein